jgi:hypothetical protein
MAWAQVALGIIGVWAERPLAFSNTQRAQIEMWILERAV